MVFRRSRETHERCLWALGYLLDRRGYERDELCILAVSDGFEIVGVGVSVRGAAYDLATRNDRISAEELADTLARLRDRLRDAPVCGPPGHRLPGPPARHRARARRDWRP